MLGVDWWARPAHRSEDDTPASSGSARDHAKVPTGDVERNGPFRAADDDVLDPGTIPPVEVDARLDAERHALAERLAVAGDQVRLLVALETDAVAGAVDEGLAVALRGDHVAGGRVDSLALDSGPDRV